MEGTHLVRSTGRTTLLDRPSPAARLSSAGPAVRATSADTVAISDSARRASLAPPAAPAAPANVPGVRTSLVERVRAEIAAGTYLNESRLDGALDALLNDLA